MEYAESLETFMAFGRHRGRARMAQRMGEGDKPETLCSCSVFGNKLEIKHWSSKGGCCECDIE